MDPNQGNKLESIEKVIRKTYEEKKIGENNVLDFIQALNYFLGDQPPDIKYLSVYKLMDDLIALLPSSREKFETRIENLKIIMEFEPKNKNLSFGLANLYELLEDHSNSIDYLQKTYDLDPGPYLLYRIGLRYRFLDNNKLAIDYFNRCISQGYTDSEVYRELGKAFSSIGDYNNAKLNLDKALSLGLDEENESRVNQLLSILEKINNATELLNKLIKQINLKPITPLYSSSEEGKFISYKGQEFSIWRFYTEIEDTEILRVSDNNSNVIDFWFKQKYNNYILGIQFSHQTSPANIQYSIIFQPKCFEEHDSNKMIQPENSDLMYPQKRNIDPKIALKEYKKFIKYLKKSGIEIIPDIEKEFM